MVHDCWAEDMLRNPNDRDTIATVAFDRYTRKPPWPGTIELATGDASQGLPATLRRVPTRTSMEAKTKAAPSHEKPQPS